MKVLITGSNGMLGHDTGSNGMLGHDLIDVLDGKHELIKTTSKSLDITDEDKVKDYIVNENPDIVINSAAYTDVDGCETNEEIAYKVNGEGVKNLALACKVVDCPLLHISTDYVFNGENNKPWMEDDEVGPISIYGKSKLQGEEAIESILDNFFIIRTSWLYGINGGNFPKTMLELAKTHDTLTVVTDEIGTPTYTLDLAQAIAELIETEYYGIYHITNSDYCSWFDFAKYIFEVKNIDVNVVPVTAEEFARPASRPHYSVLNNSNWVNNGFKPLRSYKEAIKDYLKHL